MRNENQILGSVLRHRIMVAVIFGANLNNILKEANLDRSFLSKPNAKISMLQIKNVWKILANQTQLETIGLECGLRTELPLIGVLGYAMMNSKTIRIAIEKICTYQRITSSHIFQEIHVERGFVKIELSPKKDWEETFRYGIDYIIAAYFNLVKKSTFSNIRPVKIGFNYPKPKNIKYYHEIFGLKSIVFALSKACIIYKESDLHEEMLFQNESLRTQFDTQLDDLLKQYDDIDMYTRKVRAYVIQNLNDETPKINDVAIDMAISPRSLQNHLKKEKTSFQKILITAKKDFAINYLKSHDHTISEIAFSIGFSNTSSFSKFFKKETGLSPNQYRLKLLKPS